jgi:hypothetical protein
MMVEKGEHASTWAVEEYDFENEMIAAREEERICRLSGPVPVPADQSSCTEVDVQEQPWQVDASALDYCYTLVRSQGLQDA